MMVNIYEVIYFKIALKVLFTWTLVCIYSR
jgi:hypothetical protein